MSRGRPSKLTQVLRTTEDGRQVTVGDQVVAAIRAGNYVEGAAASAGVNKTTVYAWLSEGARISTDLEQGRRRMPNPGTQDRALLDFSNAVAEAEATWEVQANTTLERLGRDQVVEEVRETYEADANGEMQVTKRQVVRRPVQADSATIRWRLERRYPTRYGRQPLEVTGVGGGPIPLSIKDQATQALEDMARQLAENAAAAAAPLPADTDPEPQQ